MKSAFLMAGVVGLSMFAAMGCEEKKANPLGDAMKDAGNKAKDATAGMAEKVKDVAGSAADKIKAEVQDLMDNTKKKVDALAKGGESLKADQKGEFDKAMSGIHSTWDDLSAKFAGLKDQAPEAMAKTLADLKDKGVKLMDTVKSTATKFGISLN
ncbi:MAG TPA: hypothetical protein PKE29_16645 [Phycisphaerales bacterium]|nr:hypothetical protein [Phycisphaerales bacterium]